MKVLTKFAKSKNVTNVEDVTQSEYIAALATSQKKQAPDDYNDPFTFQEWYTRNTGIIPSQEAKQYEEYLKNWYGSRYTPVTVATDLKTDYVNFLKELTLILNKEDKTNWLVDLNWDDPLEVEQSIPFFCKKLKEIAIYFVNKRDALRKTKLKYSMSGANQALEKLLYEYLLQAFTKRDYVLNVPDQEIFTQFPYLSNVKDGFQIEIQELYDNQNYMDKDPSLSASYYFDTTNPDITAYYDSLNVSPTAYEWLFKTGFTQLCANNPLFWIVGNIVNSELPLSAFDNGILTEYLKFKMSEKYIGTNQFYITGGYYIPWEKPIDYSMIKGNNWFYWPSGEYVQEFSDMVIDPLPIVSSALIKSGATGSKNYLSADKIFIKFGNTVSGAWLRYTNIETTTDTMSAKLDTENLNIFRFPYPGYGLSGDDLPWTGKLLSNLSNDFDYLPTDLQEYIKDTYWTTNTTNSALCAIPVNETTLIDNGAYASKIYNEADRINIRVTDNIDKIHDTSPNDMYQAEMKHSWLYKVDKTDIPVSRGQNYIAWPLYRYNKNDTVLNQILTSECAPIALSSITIEAFAGSRSGTGLFDSDLIYKLDSRNGMPIECAYLSGSPLNGLGNSTFMYGATGSIQSNLSLKCKAGEYITFIWQDDDTYIEDTNIKNIPHQSDCPYLFEDHYSLFKENPADQKGDIDYRLWQKCECKSIIYSPIGHPGTVYDDYKGMTDIIFLDTLHPVPFTTNTWVGMDGKDYKESEDFAWFQLTGTRVEPDVGWGEGRWVAGGIPSNGRRFQFKKGYQYKYLRASLGHNQTFLVDGTVPYMIVKYIYQNTPLPVWKRALVDQTGNWQPDNEDTDMVLRPSDYLVYDHIDSNWYCITSIGDLGQSSNYSISAKNISQSVWQNYDFVTSGQSVKLLWPSKLFTNGPSALAFQLTAVTWGINTPNGGSHWYLRNQDETMQIYADQIGSWVINVTGHFANGYSGGSVMYNNVGNFTVSPKLEAVTLSGSNNVETIYADTINMSINATLKGWNYTTNSYDGTSDGARPFWAYASNKNDKITKHKGIDVWGGGIQFVDDYVPITQPAFSDIVFNIDTYTEYKANNVFNWIQPITLKITASSSNWCDLLIDATRVATLSDYLYNINQELIISATINPSQMVLLPKINEYPVFVNYWANNTFVWSETLTNSSLGIPPTGGVFVPITSALLIESVFPYANLTNRHFPTIATVPHIEKLYTKSETGGYFIPRMLGASTFLSKNNKNMLDTSKLLTNYENRGLSAVYQDITSFTTDDGLSQKDQITPVSSVEIDSSWMKASVSEWNKAGMIIDPIYYQQMMPYKTKYENTQSNDIGLRRQGDAFDPWFGDNDDIWENPTDFPSDFKKQYNIDKWYEQFNNNGKQVWAWRGDIFGNTYALLKTLSGQSMYEKKNQVGDLWTRNNRSIVSPASASLSAMFVNYASLSVIPSLLSEVYEIQNIDLWYDTFMIKTKNYVLINKIDFNFETNIIDFNINNSHIVNLSENNAKYAGTWFFPEDKSVTIAILVSSVSGIYPQLRNLDLEKNQMTYIYNKTSSETDLLSTLQLTTLEEPIFTFNKDSNTYNMAFIGYSSNYSGMILNNIYIVDSGDNHYISKVSSILPLK
jgi:hypothetical protein